MDYYPIHQQLNSLSPITPDAWKDLSALFNQVALNKGDYLLQEGERAQYCYLQIEGVTRVFYNNDGNEYNKTFFVPGMFPTALTSLLSNSPSGLSFQALTKSSYISFPYNRFRKLFDRHRCLESFLLKVLETEWVKKEAHDIRMVTNDATENYLMFRQLYPGLENQIPQYHIASYLGVTPIQLSRIRANLVNSG